MADTPPKTRGNEHTFRICYVTRIVLVFIIYNKKTQHLKTLMLARYYSQYFVRIIYFTGTTTFPGYLVGKRQVGMPEGTRV